MRAVSLHMTEFCRCWDIALKDTLNYMVKNGWWCADSNRFKYTVPTPSDINNGCCAVFADFLTKHFPDCEYVEFNTHAPHVMIKYKDHYYDSETSPHLNQGVKNHLDCPLYKSILPRKLELLVKFTIRALSFLRLNFFWHE